MRRNINPPPSAANHSLQVWHLPRSFLEKNLAPSLRRSSHTVQGIKLKGNLHCPLTHVDRLSTGMLTILVNKCHLSHGGFLTAF